MLEMLLYLKDCYIQYSLYEVRLFLSVVIVLWSLIRMLLHNRESISPKVWLVLLGKKIILQLK